MDKKIKNIKKNTTRSTSLISKIKIKYNYPPSIGEYTGTKLHSRINEILTSISTYNKKSNSTANILIKEEYIKNAKENIIISLREDLKYHKKINRHYLLYKQYTNDIYNYYKQNYEEINKFKGDLCHDLCDFIKVIENYETKIKKSKEDKDIIIKTNNDIIKYKLNEKEKMNERINVLNYDLDKQKIKLEEINNILNEYKAQNENYLEKLNNTELNYIEQYEILEDKYKKLKAQYDYYYDKETKKRLLELQFKNDNLCKDEKDLVNLKLQDNIIKNIFLKEIANDIKQQINKIESFNQKNTKDEALIKFLGKAFYNKVKQRKAENENNHNNKSKSNIINTSQNIIELKNDKNGSKSKLKNKYKKMKKKYGLNLVLNNTNNTNNNIIYNNYKNYNRINKFNKNKNNTYFITSFNIGNNLKETCFSTSKNTKNNNKFNLTSTGSS